MISSQNLGLSCFAYFFTNTITDFVQNPSPKILHFELKNKKKAWTYNLIVSSGTVSGGMGLVKPLCRHTTSRRPVRESESSSSRLATSQLQPPGHAKTRGGLRVIHNAKQRSKTSSLDVIVILDNTNLWCWDLLNGLHEAKDPEEWRLVAVDYNYYVPLTVDYSKKAIILSLTIIISKKFIPQGFNSVNESVLPVSAIENNISMHLKLKLLSGTLR